jgi:hypothetical protein
MHHGREVRDQKLLFFRNSSAKKHLAEAPGE